MLKGTQKQIIFLKDTKSGIFDEAYFVLKPSGTAGLTHSDMISEANRIIDSHTVRPVEKKDEKKKKKNTHALRNYIFGILSGILMSVISYFIFCTR